MSERDETREAVARAILNRRSKQDFRTVVDGAWIVDHDLELADAALKALHIGSRFTVEGVECVVVPKPDAWLLWKMTEILGEWIMDQKSEDDVFRAMLRACEEKGDG